jgi:methylene-fatty-acyl-phospholipid synthase
VFAAWCLVYGNGSLAPAHPGPIVLGGAAALVVVGQILVIATFYRLGRTGVFFGDRFGYEVRHCREFPFSLLSHPQYVGTMLTIWGVFLALRFPHADWYVLPAVETVYYAAATWLESPRRSAQGLRKRIVPM